MARPFLAPAAKSSAQLRILLKPGEKGIIGALAKAEGQSMGDLIKALCFEQVQERFLLEVLQPALQAAIVGPASRAGSVNPGGRKVILAPDDQQQAALAMWVRAAPDVWRTNQGDLLPSERKSRTELLKEYGGSALEDALAAKIGSPAVSLEDLAEAYGHLDRDAFAREFLGYKPSKKVEASSSFEAAAKKGSAPRNSRSSPSRPMKRV